MTDTPLGPITRVRTFLATYSLVLGGLAVISLVVAIVLYVFLTELELAANILLGLCGLFLILFVIGAYSEVKGGVTSRQARYGTNTSLMVVAFVGIVGMMNVVAAQNHFRWDLTEGGQFTLARQTTTVLNNLKGPVKVTGFFTNDPQMQALKEQSESLLKEYKFHSSQVSYEFVDPEEKPGVARQYNVTSNGTLVFEFADKRKLVNGYQEQDFTGAILNVTGTVQPIVYFITGHGEHDPNNSTAGSGYGFVRDGLIADNYDVQILNLASITTIPDDAALVVVAGPKRPFLAPEMQALSTYLDNGGKALFLLNPDVPAEFTPQLARWGVMVKQGTLVDHAIFAQPDVTTPAVQGGQYLYPQITRDLAASFFPGAIGMQVEIPKDDEDHVKASALAITSGQSFLETSPSGIQFDASTDIRGPLPLALVVEATKPIGQRPPLPQAGVEAPKQTRMVVFADSDFATNDFFFSLGNGDLILNSVNWLTAQEELISIRPKGQLRRLVVTQQNWNVILYSTLALWPAVVLLGGAYAWWRRR